VLDAVKAINTDKAVTVIIIDQPLKMLATVAAMQEIKTPSNDIVCLMTFHHCTSSSKGTGLPK
jgi:5,10-methylene-tetrahydrofolate dehydrogenase/methenyl tetrahydrofolate cyclohydrolase